MDHHATQVVWNSVKIAKRSRKAIVLSRNASSMLQNRSWYRSCSMKKKEKGRLHRLRNPVVENLEENSLESLATKAVIMMRMSCLRRITVSDICQMCIESCKNWIISIDWVMLTRCNCFLLSFNWFEMYMSLYVKRALRWR